MVRVSGIVSNRLVRRASQRIGVRGLMAMLFMLVCIPQSYAATLLVQLSKTTVNEANDFIKGTVALRPGINDSGTGICSVRGTLTTGGTAIEGLDYSISNKNFALVSDFTAGTVRTAPFNISIVNDDLPEVDETIFLTATITTISCNVAVQNLGAVTALITSDDAQLQPLTANEDKAVTTIDKPLRINVLQNDFFVGDLEVNVIAITEARNGTVAINVDKTIAYTPNDGFVGKDTFGYTISDGIDTSSSVVTVEVGPGVNETITEDEEENGGGGGGGEKPQLVQVIDSICINSTTRNLKVQCQRLNRLNATGLRNAIRQIEPRQIAAQGTHAAELGGLQMRNVEARLLSRRVSTTGLLSFEDLSLSINGRTVPAELYTRKNTQLQRGASLRQPSEQTAESERKNRKIVEAEDPSDLGVYVNGHVNVGDKDDTDNEAGFDFDSQALTVGVDYRMSPEQVVGGALGVGSATSDFANNGGKLDVDTFAASVYTSFELPEAMFVDVVATLGNTDYKQVRNIRFPGTNTQAFGDAEGDYIGIAANAGMHKNLGGGWLLTPYGRIELLSLEIDGYAERGGQGLAVNVNEQKVKSTKLTLAAEISKAIKTKWGALVPSAYLELESQLGDSVRDIELSFVENPGIAFALKTDKPDSTYFNLGLALSATIKDRYGAYVSVQSTVAQDDFSNTSVNAGFRFEF